MQLPTKLPRPLPAFQRAGTSTAKTGGSSSAGAGAAAGGGKGKGKGKAAGELGVDDGLLVGGGSSLVKKSSQRPRSARVALLLYL